jgi:DNA-binding response OmpR family regulator
MMKKKILIVDDDSFIQGILKIIFERSGFEVEASTDGLALLEKRDYWPDFLIIDKNLQGYDGVEICKFLKGRLTTKNIPVLIISGAPGIEPLAKRAGAEEFLEKPFTTRALMSKVWQYVSPPPSLV